jgi:hypothetical protein
VSLSVYHKDSGNPVRIRIKNSSGNWLTTAGTWSGSEQNASNFSTARDEIRFTMESTGSTLQVDFMSPNGVGNYTDVGHVQIEDRSHFGVNPPASVVTSVMVSGAGATFVRNADIFYVANTSTSGRSFEYWNQGTFRCIWKPLLSEADVTNGTVAYFFDVVDAGAGNATKFLFRYQGSAPGAGNFRVGWGGGVTMLYPDPFGITAGQEYKLILRWTGSNGELDGSQGDVDFFVYDPVGTTWYTSSGSGTQPASVTNSNAYIACSSGFYGWGYFTDIEVLPFVLTDEECKDYP